MKPFPWFRNKQRWSGDDPTHDTTWFGRLAVDDDGFFRSDLKRFLLADRKMNTRIFPDLGGAREVLLRSIPKS